MIWDLQKASIWKRVSAFLLDMIILGIIAVLFALIISAVSGYDSKSSELQARYDALENKYGITFQISNDDYQALPEEKRSMYDKAYQEFNADHAAVLLYHQIMNITIMTVSLSLLSAFLIVEFAVPMIMKNGQTVGKKVFGIAVMHANGVRVTPVAMLTRTLLGKYAIETMVPALIILMIYFNTIGIVGVVVIGLIAVLQAVLMIATKTNSMIHDVLSNTVVVDMASQLIFDTQQQMIEFKKAAAAEQAERQKY